MKLYILAIITMFAPRIHAYEMQPTYELTPENVAQELMSLYQDAADAAYIGEEVSQLEHALQTAQQALYAFDERIGIDEETIIAALLHDIGHRYSGKDAQDMDGFGVAEHEKIGAAMLKNRGFSDKVTRLVAGHVNAKRYKVFKDNAYRNKLTYASQQTLLRQGGAMTQEEAAAFENDPYHQQILRIRDWEEKAKIPSAPTPSLPFFKLMIIRHLQKTKS